MCKGGGEREIVPEKGWKGTNQEKRGAYVEWLGKEADEGEWEGGQGETRGAAMQIFAATEIETIRQLESST